MAERIALVINDLIFETKIRSTAQAFGVEVITARDRDGLVKALDEPGVTLVIIDLNSASAVAASAIEAGKAHPLMPRVVAYVSHVDTDLAEQARAAGADDVLPRSRFAAELPAMLEAFARGT